MTTAHDIDWPAVLAERLTTTHPDVLRELLTTFIHTLMGAEADALCGAGYGQRSAERTNQRNGYRHRQFDTRTGTLDLAIPSCDTTRTSRTGYWSVANAPSGR
jgi:putative transposase